MLDLRFAKSEDRLCGDACVVSEDVGRGRESEAVKCLEGFVNRREDGLK